MNAAVPTAALQAADAETLTLQVRSIRMEAEGIHAFELVDPNGGDLPATEAGAHVDVHLPGGVVATSSQRRVSLTWTMFVSAWVACSGFRACRFVRPLPRPALVDASQGRSIFLYSVHRRKIQYEHAPASRQTAHPQ